MQLINILSMGWGGGRGRGERRHVSVQERCCIKEQVALQFQRKHLCAEASITPTSAKRTIAAQEGSHGGGNEPPNPPCVLFYSETCNPFHSRLRERDIGSDNEVGRRSGFIQASGQKQLLLRMGRGSAPSLWKSTNSPRLRLVRLVWG